MSSFSDVILPGTKPFAEDDNIVIDVNGISKMYMLFNRPVDRLKQTLFWRLGKSYGKEFWALRDVSLKVHKGETVGILGRNGSGKSTLLQTIAGVLQPTFGSLQIKGRVSALLELGSGFNPEYSGRENVFMNGAILGFDRLEMQKRYDEIVSFAEIGEFIDQPVKTYSSGMVMRLAFAVAACIEPDILIVDEALAVGDVLFQARCFEKIKKLRDSGTTTLFVTHDTSTFQNICDYGYVLEHGKIFAQGKPTQVALQYYELMRESEHTHQRLTSINNREQDEAAVGEATVDEAAILVEAKQKEEEIQGKVKEGEYRFGTGKAQIISYGLLNQDLKETSTFHVGEKVTISVQVKALSHLEHLALGIMFRNPQGQNLMGMHTYHENRINLGVLNKGDILEIVCEQEMLLNPGDYLLSIGVADHRTDYDFTNLDSRNNLTKISVYGKTLAYGLIHTTPSFSINGIVLKKNTAA